MRDLVTSHAGMAAILGVGAAFVACSGSSSSTGSGGASSASSTSSSSSASSTGSSSSGIGGSSSASASSSSTTSSSSSGAGGGKLAPCPTQGKGGIVAPAGCFVFTPADAGANPAGANATEDTYALEPGGAPRATLLVHFNGSGGKPSGQIHDPQKNFYDAAASQGYHVIGLAYRSDVSVGMLCAGAGDCFGPTRQTLILGSYQNGAAASLKNITEDEGIAPRLVAALKLLAKERPGQGWDQYLTGNDPDATKDVAWSKIATSGHSQGGGHAAMIAQMFGIERAVQLSSTCDAPAGTPAPWTDAAASWATSPKTAIYGFAAPTTFTNGKPTSGDTTCPYHVAVWQNMGMDPQNQHDDADTCGGMADTHGASIGCITNYPRWVDLLK